MKYRVREVRYKDCTVFYPEYTHWWIPFFWAYVGSIYGFSSLEDAFSEIEKDKVKQNPPRPIEIIHKDKGKK